MTIMAPRSTDLQIDYRDPRLLAPSPLNPRTHSTGQITKIAKSIRAFGFNNPVLLDSAGQIIAGHGRVLAAIELGMAHVPTVPLSHLSDAQKRAYVIADNRLCEVGGDWDAEILAINFGALMEADLDFDITDIGFEMPEIEATLLADDDTALPADTIDRMEMVPQIARPGDLWALGDHLIFCGDALDRYSHRILMGAERAAMVFTDPPYNLKIEGNVSGLGRARHGEFAMASGEMSPPQFSAFLRRVLDLACSTSIDGALHYVCMDWRHVGEMHVALDGLYSELKNICVWVKSNGGMGSFYRSQHELIFVAKVGRAPHVNNIQLGKHGRNRSNVWNYAGMNSFHAGRDEALALHPTVKPVAMVADAIYDCTSRGSLIFDPFGGSGTTLLAAHKAKRRARLIEIDPRYVDVTVHRFLKETGIEARNLLTGQIVTAGGGMFS